MDTLEEYHAHHDIGNDGLEGQFGEILVNHVSLCEGDGVTSLRFDTEEESLWVGTANGYLVQTILTDLSRHAYVSCHHSEPILDLRSTGHSCISVSASQLCLHFSGCVPRLDFWEPAGDLTAVEFDGASRRVLLGHAAGGIASFDLVTGRPGFSIDTKGKGVAALAGPVSRGRLAVGTIDGHLSLCDTRTGRTTESSLPAHTGGFASLDGLGDYIATSGYIERYGRLSLEPIVKVFDVRMGLRMLMTIPFTGGASSLRFNPSYASNLMILSESGLVSLTDVGGYMGHGETYGIQTGGDVLLSGDVSATGLCYAFGSSSGYVHLWSSCTEPVASYGGQVPLGPDEDSFYSTSTYYLDEEEPFSKVPLCFTSDGGPLASDVNPKALMTIGMAPRVIDNGILSTGKTSDFVTYVPNFKKEASMKPGQAAAAISNILDARRRPKVTAESAEAERAARAARRASEGGTLLPSKYRRVIIKHQTGTKFEEFDFSIYNRTPFPGLENGIANCYVNAVLQVLFFTQGIRKIALQHCPSPDTEFSLLGELSLLFRMLITAQGHVCQASNLLRALRQSREAVALGLIEGVRGERGAADIEVEAQKDRNLTRRTWRFARYLIEQLNKEQPANKTKSVAKAGKIAPQDTMVESNDRRKMQETLDSATEIEKIFAVLQKQRTKCLSRKRPDQFRFTRAFQIDLQYPPAQERPPMEPAWQPSASYGISSNAGNLKSTLKSSPSTASLSSRSIQKEDDNQDLKGKQPRLRPSFSDVLSSSLHTSSEMRAWFDEEVTYQFVKQERVPLALPKILALNCGLEDRGNLAWWQTNKNHHSNCEVQSADESWLPPAIAIAADPVKWNVHVSQGITPESAEELLKNKIEDINDTIKATYELTAVVAHIVDEDEAADGGDDYEGHMIAQVQVPTIYFDAQKKSVSSMEEPFSVLSSKNKGNDSKKEWTNVETANIKDPSEECLQPGNRDPTPAEASRWMLFNDFHITSCSQSEVLDLYSGQKCPAMLFFTRKDVAASSEEDLQIETKPVMSAEEFLSLCRTPSIQSSRSRVRDLSFEPLKDHEIPTKGSIFALDAEFVAYSPPEKIVRRGFDVESRPSRLGLGRVSVIRGEGSRVGVPCIDDYIRSVEPVYDYLTQFSGLVHGDLDESRSKHYLTTLRRAYLKLRYMVDAGAIFVGHGLKKDFRMLNIVVPKDQIIDTSDLYYSGQGRRLSLRFLAAYLLRSNIQTGSHDSIEDASTALQLYRVHQQLVKDGVFESTLSEMFEWGASAGWDPNLWEHPPPSPIDQTKLLASS